MTSSHFSAYSDSKKSSGGLHADILFFQQDGVHVSCVGSLISVFCMPGSTAGTYQVSVAEALDEFQFYVKWMQALRSSILHGGTHFVEHCRVV